MPKRRKTADAEDVEESTPRKSRRTGQLNGEESAVETPSRRKSILRGTPTNAHGVAESTGTPKNLRKVLFSTPSKPAEAEEAEEAAETPTAARNDRSARRKSVQALQNHTANDESEEEDDAQEAAVAKQILDEDDSDEDEVDIEPSSTPAIPSKRSRPKGKRRSRTPSPPPNLPPHEQYFFQNRPGGTKTSTATLPSHLLLNHSDYYTHISAYKDPHEADIKRLKELHKRAFDQWRFELAERFNLCLYGYGSKRGLAMEFAEEYYASFQAQGKNVPKIVVVNGYTPNLTIRDVLTTLAGVILPPSATTALPKLPTLPQAILDLLLLHLTTIPPSQPILLLIHSLDHPNLRKPLTQNLLASLSSHPAIRLLATVDTPHFSLLWSLSLTRQYKFLYHDTTTFEPYTVEIGGSVVEDVNDLLGRGRRGRRGVGGRDGVAFVLKSLPENARGVFRLILGEQLSAAAAEDVGPRAPGVADSDDDEGILGASDEEAAANQQDTPSRRGRGRKKPKPKHKPSSSAPTTLTQEEGVDYRTLYNLSVQSFLCSSELNFRTLLKEFHDHDIIESRRDAMGMERLVVPFSREEMEGLVEELES